MSVDYVIHIFDAPEFPLEMDDLLVHNRSFFFPEFREVLNRYTTEEMVGDPVKFADASKDFRVLEDKAEAVEAEYLKRHLTPDGKHLPAKDYEDLLQRLQSNPNKWEAWSLSYWRIGNVPMFNLGSDDGGYKSPNLISVEKAYDALCDDHGLCLINVDLIKAIAADSDALAMEDHWNNRGPTLSEFFMRHRNRRFFIIAH